MNRQWLSVLVSVILLAIAIVVLDLLLAGLYFLASGARGNLAFLLSNILFFEGGLVLLIGAAIEFFQIGGKDYRFVVKPRAFIPGLAGHETGNGGIEVKNPGWLLIFLGGALIGFSLACALLFA